MGSGLLQDVKPIVSLSEEKGGPMRSELRLELCLNCTKTYALVVQCGLPLRPINYPVGEVASKASKVQHQKESKKNILKLSHAGEIGWPFVLCFFWDTHHSRVSHI